MRSIVLVGAGKGAMLGIADGRNAMLLGKVGVMILGPADALVRNKAIPHATTLLLLGHYLLHLVPRRRM